MARVLTNNTTLAFGLQPAQGIDPTQFTLLEPNAITEFGATITTVARSPISKGRQLRKGLVTDLDSTAAFDSDLTGSSFKAFNESFIFSTSVNADLDFNPSAVTATGYTVPALTAAQAGKLLFTAGGPISLIFSRAFSTAVNNGLKALTVNPATSATELAVAGLTIEAVPPTNAETEIGGIRPEIGDLAIVVTAAVAGVSPATAVLSSGNNAATNNIDFTVLGLTVGQFVHVGGVLAGNQFSAGAGYARITAIAAGQLDLDKLDTALTTDPGAGEIVDLLFGRFTRNVDVDAADFIEQFLMFEATFDKLDNPAADMFQYSKDNLANTMAVNLPLTDKATITFGFIGTDTDNPTATQKTGALTPISPNQTGGFSTTADTARLQVTSIIEEALSTDFKSLTLTLTNNASAEKVLSQLGAKFMNTGNFEANLEAQLLFTNADVVSAIRDNDTVALDFRVNNDDGAIYFDIPNMALGDGSREFPVNETVLINISGQAFGDPASIFTYSLGVSQFPIVP